MSIYCNHKISAYSIRKGFDSFENYLNHDIDEIESIEELEEQVREYFWHVWVNMDEEEQAEVLNGKFGHFLDSADNHALEYIQDMEFENSPLTEDVADKFGLDIPFAFYATESGEFLNNITFYTGGSDGEEVVDDAMTNSFHGSSTLKAASESIMEVVKDFKNEGIC